MSFQKKLSLRFQSHWLAFKR